MTVQKPNFPSFSSIVSILSILLYCAGFLKVELELKDQKNRINHLENIVQTNPPSNDGSLVRPIKNVPGKFMVTFTINFSEMKATAIFDSLLTCYMWAKLTLKSKTKTKECTESRIYVYSSVANKRGRQVSRSSSLPNSSQKGFTAKLILKIALRN